MSGELEIEQPPTQEETNPPLPKGYVAKNSNGLPPLPSGYVKKKEVGIDNSSIGASAQVGGDVGLGGTTNTTEPKVESGFDIMRNNIKRGAQAQINGKISTGNLTGEDLETLKKINPEKHTELTKNISADYEEDFLKTPTASGIIAERLNKSTTIANLQAAKTYDAAYHNNLDEIITHTSEPVNKFLEATGVPFQIKPTKDIEESKQQLQFLTEADKKNQEQYNKDKIVTKTTAVQGTLAGVGVDNTIEFDVSKMDNAQIEAWREQDPELYSKLVEAKQKTLNNETVSSAIHTALVPIQTQLGNNLYSKAKSTNVKDLNKDYVREIGEEQYKITNPEKYALFQQAGGYDNSKPESEQTYSSELDGVNKEIMSLGYNALKGDVAANGTPKQFANVYDNLKYLNYKFSAPLEEETKHMIAATLKMKGIKPSAASDEEKDEIAKTLPLENQQVWFNKTKGTTNDELPDTGFLYSAGNSFVKAGSNILKSGSVLSPTSWATLFMGVPSDKEIAKEALGNEIKSDVVGENPETLSLYNQLKEKQTNGTITTQELNTLNNLSQYNDVRSNWDKFADGSANMVGMIGAVTLDAIPTLGGSALSSSAVGARNILVSENAAQSGVEAVPVLQNGAKTLAQKIGVPHDTESIINFAKNKNEMYVLTHHDNAVKATELFPDNDTKKAWYTGITDVLAFALPNILPTHKIGNLFTTEAKDIVAETVSKISTENLDKAVIDNMMKETASKIIGKAGTFLVGTEKTAAETALTMSLLTLGNNVTQAALKPESISGNDISNNFMQTLSATFMDSQLIGLVGGRGAVQKKYGQVGTDAIYDATNSINSTNAVKYAIFQQKESGLLTEAQANDKVSLLNTASQLRPAINDLQKQENLSTNETKKIFINLLNERILKNQILKLKESGESESLIAPKEKRLLELTELNSKIIGREVTVNDKYSIVDKNNEEIADTFTVDGKHVTETEVKEILSKGQTEADKYNIEYTGKNEEIHNELKSFGATTDEVNNKSISPKGRETVLSEGVNDLYDKLEGKAPIHYLDPLNKEGSINELSSQALTAPQSLKGDIGEPLVLQLIARNSVEDINKSIDDWTKVATKEGATPSELNDADRHIKLLEKGLEEKGNIHEKSNPVQPTVESAVIEINGKTYEGKNHAEAILKAQEAGEDISNVDRKAEGKFKLSDGTVIDRVEAKERFGQDKSELLIEQDEAAKEADKNYTNTGLSKNGLDRADAKKVYQEVRQLDEPTDARGLVLSYLAHGGKVGEDAINEAAGNVKRASLNTGKETKSNEVKLRDYSNKKGEGIDAIVHSIWDNLPEHIQEKIDIQDLKNEMQDAISNHETRLSAAKEFVKSYGIEEPVFVDEKIITEGEQKLSEYLNSESELNYENEFITDNEILNIINHDKENETINQQSSERTEGTSNETNSADGSQKQGENGKEPPTGEKPIDKESGGEKLSDKGILNHLSLADNVPEVSKKGFEEKGLKYKPQTQQEAEAIGKSIVDKYGIEEATLLAEASKFKGGVNSAIFADSLNRLYELEQNAKTPKEKLEYATKFAEIGIKYDEFAREQGRDISHIGYFYKKSPLGIKIMEEARRSEDFKEWFKNKDKNYQEFFDEMMKEPEFENIIKDKVREELKKERSEARESRKKKVDAFFDKAKDQFKGGAAYSTIIPPKVITAALDGMQKAYHAGEKIAEIVQNAIDYISTEVADWDKEKFRKEWEEKLKEPLTKKTTEELSAEKQQKLLDRFRNKLKGLSNSEKEEVIRRSFKKLVENGALEYKEFKDIIADIIGLGKLSEEDSKRITELVKEINNVDDLAKKARETDRSEKSIKEYLVAKKKSEKSATDLSYIIHSKPRILNRLLSIMQLNTLGIPSLVNNPIFNIVNQSLVRFPKSVQLTVLDKVAEGISKMAGKDYKGENDFITGQGEFWKKLGRGTKESATQLVTGLTSSDYFQKEVHASQIKPYTSMVDLWDFGRSSSTGNKLAKLFGGKEVEREKRLSAADITDKTLQATVGIPAEMVARVLNLGDKPQRYATEGAQAAKFAKNLGLKDIDYKLFMEFPKEEAYRKFKSEGMSDEMAMKKAEVIQEKIIKEGQESTFQQENILNDVLNGILENSGNLKPALTVAKTLNMPFVKIPLNAYWSYFNLVNPEIALLQSAYYGSRAAYNKAMGKEVNPHDVQASKKWLAHATTGMALLAAGTILSKAGVINASNDDDTSKKERQGERQYEQSKSVNMGKLFALMQGKNPDDVKDGLQVDLKWFGVMGNVADLQQQKIEGMTPEQKEKGMTLMEDALSKLKISGMEQVNQGVFANTSNLLESINRGNMDNYGLNLINMASNIVQPAMFAQVSRAQLPYYSKQKGDTFYQKVKNNFLTRSATLRKLTGEYPPSAIGIWGDRLDRKDNTIQKLFGMTTQDKDNFAEAVYDDYRKTNNTKFFPSAIKSEIKVGDETKKLNTKETEQLEILVGQRRKTLVAPYVNDMATFPGSKKKYSELSDEEKIKNLDILYDEGFKQGKELFIEAHPEYKYEETKQDKKSDSKRKSESEKLRAAAHKIK